MKVSTLGISTFQEFAPWRALGAGVILQALRDVRGPDILRAFDAALWLMSEDATALMDDVDVLGDPSAWLRSGARGRLTTNGKRRK